MIFIRPNPTFYGQLYPCGGIDAATVHRAAAAAACHAEASKQNNNPSYSVNGPSCGGRRAGPRRCFRGAPVQKQEQVTATTRNSNDVFVDSDSKVMMEKTPVHRNETSEKTIISLDVAGFEPEHLKVEIEDHVLMVSAERTNKLGDTFVTRRRFALKADVYDEDSVHADLEDGVLEITVQKKVATASRHIPITVTLSSVSSLNNNQNDECDMSDVPSLNHHHHHQSSVVEDISVETVDEKNDHNDNNDGEDEDKQEGVEEKEGEDEGEPLFLSSSHQQTTTKTTTTTTSPDTTDDAWEEVLAQEA